MKKIFLGLLAVFATLFTSCEFSETIYVNEDGTGKMSLYLDGSDLMPMMGNKLPIGGEEPIDSIVSFKDVLGKAKFNIANLSKEDQKNIKNLEKLNIHMMVDANKNKMNFDVFADFNSISDIKGMFEGMEAIGKIAKDRSAMRASDPLAAVDFDKLTKMDYSYKNNIFKRSFRVLDQKLVDSLKQNLGQAEMLLAASSYKLDYHFPRKIKSVSLKDAVIGKDGKSFVFEVNVMEFVDNPEILNFEVELEK
ncbi:hypothetical protein [uncultured Kordia sp.]|uniref:hypothetical protein n=1 Tax=uncultured Kordia sp. TaxID=507699 RepID=UPI0026239FDB|nr:hypothetical protein [uncultured Kordia sp.]